MNERDDKGEKVRDNTSYQFFFGLWTKSGPHCQYKIPPLPAHQQVTVYVCRASTHIHSTCLAMDCCYRDSTLRWECLAIWFPQRDCGLERGGRRTRRGVCGSGVADSDSGDWNPITPALLVSTIRNSYSDHSTHHQAAHHPSFSCSKYSTLNHGPQR